MEVRPGRVLIVDQDQGGRDFLATRLKQWGYETLIAPDGRQGLEMAKTAQPDIVMLDVRAPEVAADEVLRSLKADETLCDIPVIMLATADDLEAVSSFLALGVEDYLLRPFSPTVLKTQAHDYIAISRQRQEERDRARQTGLLKIEHDVEIARQIQLGFLPRDLPNPEGWDVAGRFHPARQVAGDWYDGFYMANKRRVAVSVGDVCDKGVGSALFMALFRSLLRAFSQQNLSLRWMDTSSGDWLSDTVSRRKALLSPGTSAAKTAVQITNSYICENHGDTNYFATMFLGVINPADGSVAYVNAGHPAALVVDAAGHVRDRLKPTGPALGLFADAAFDVGEANLASGDALFIFSDGVTDARDAKGQLFGEKRLMELLSQPAPSASALLDHVEAGLHSHTGSTDQFDDITMVAAKRHPQT